MAESLRKQTKRIDMTTGPILKNAVLFALPICLGSILQYLYGTVDTFVIGKYCDKISLAAVGTSSEPVEILLCIFLGIGSGVSILTSRFAGAGDLAELKKVVRTGIAFLYMAAIPLTILGVLLGPLLIKLIQAPEETWDLCSVYICITFLGTLANMGYNLNAGILRGMGDSKPTLLFLAVSCVVNIAGDLLLTGVLGFGVAGVAVATVIAQYVSWILSVIYLKGHFRELKVTFLPKKADMAVLKRIISIGLPLGLNNSIYSVGHIMLKAVINLQGTDFVAGCSVSGKVTGIANIAIVSLANAASTYAGQNLGAGNYKRIKKGAPVIIGFNGLVTMLSGIIMTWFFCEPVLRLFTDDPEVLYVAIRYVRLVLPSSWCYAVLSTAINYCNGLGIIKYPTAVNLLMLWAVRIPAAYIIHWFFDGQYCMLAYPISYVFGMVCMVLFFFSKTWKNTCKAERIQL